MTKELSGSSALAGLEHPWLVDVHYPASVLYTSAVSIQLSASCKLLSTRPWVVWTYACTAKTLAKDPQRRPKWFGTIFSTASCILVLCLTHDWLFSSSELWTSPYPGFFGQFLQKLFLSKKLRQIWGLTPIVSFSKGLQSWASYYLIF